MTHNMLLDSLFEGGYLGQYVIEEEGPGRRRVEVQTDERWFYWSVETDQPLVVTFQVGHQRQECQ